MLIKVISIHCPHLLVRTTALLFISSEKYINRKTPKLSPPPLISFTVLRIEKITFCKKSGLFSLVEKGRTYIKVHLT